MCFQVSFQYNSVFTFKVECVYVHFWQIFEFYIFLVEVVYNLCICIMHTYIYNIILSYVLSRVHNILAAFIYKTMNKK